MIDEAYAECVWRSGSPELALGAILGENHMHGAENRCGAFFMYGVHFHADTSSLHYCTALISSEYSTQATASTPESTDNFEAKSSNMQPAQNYTSSCCPGQHVKD